MSNILYKLTREPKESLEINNLRSVNPKFNIHDLHFELQNKTLYLQKHNSFLALSDVI